MCVRPCMYTTACGMSCRMIPSTLSMPAQQCIQSVQSLLCLPSLLSAHARGGRATALTQGRIGASAWGRMMSAYRGRAGARRAQIRAQQALAATPAGAKRARERSKSIDIFTTKLRSQKPLGSSPIRAFQLKSKPVEQPPPPRSQAAKLWMTLTTAEVR